MWRLERNDRVNQKCDLGTNMPQLKSTMPSSEVPPSSCWIYASCGSLKKATGLYQCFILKDFLQNKGVPSDLRVAVLEVLQNATQCSRPWPGLGGNPSFSARRWVEKAVWKERNRLLESQESRTVADLSVCMTSGKLAGVSGDDYPCLETGNVN